MKKWTTFLLSLPFFTSPLFSQTLSAPQAEGVYGGRVRLMASYPISADSTRVIISTESANSLFFADLASKNAASLTNLGAFQTIPGADMDDNFGANIQALAAHAGSGLVFFSTMGQVYSVHPSGGLATNLGLMADALLIRGDHIFAMHGNQLHCGTLDSAGQVSPFAFSPITLPSSIQMGSLHSGADHRVYAYSRGASPVLLGSTNAYDSFSSSTSFTNISLSGMISSNTQYGAFGQAPDSSFYFMGNHYPTGSNTSDWIEISRSQNFGLSWMASTIGGPGSVVGQVGGNIQFGGNHLNYRIYNGSRYNDGNGNPLNWQSFGQVGGVAFGYAPNDGPVAVDPLNDSLIYFTTDVAFGYSTDKGHTTKALNTGITAVQVFDMDMTSDYNTAWVASKSGIRKLSNYQSTPIWSPTQFPLGDGSGYSAADMANDDTNTVYVGNVRIYKSSDGGLSWRKVFEPTQGSSAIFPPSGTQCVTLEVNPFDTSIVLAGFANTHSDLGGLFLSEDGGNSWQQILIHASAGGPDADVHDVVFTHADTAYVGVEYDLSNPGARSVYKLALGSSPSLSQEFDACCTATGSSITASIFDLEVSPTGDTLFAAGTDAGANHPICYYKEVQGGKWQVISTSGFPTGMNQVASAVTIGAQTVFCAVGSEIYTYDLNTATNWNLGYAYPNGTKINFLFYDELLVGTGTGLYAQDLSNNVGLQEAFQPDPKVQLYPNPSRGQLQVECAFEVQQVRIYNSQGQLVKTLNPLNKEFEVALDDLPKGLYFMALDGKTESAKGNFILN